MLSRITIEVDFENKNTPVIQILQHDSDDVRDKLLRNFLQSLQDTSRWASIIYKGVKEIENKEYGALWHIVPISPTISELEEEVKTMQTLINSIKNIPDELSVPK